MIELIIDGISEQLNSIFGNDYKIYTEQVKQGLKEPCFFIQLINSVNTSFIDIKYFRKYSFCIKYFPATKEPKNECFKVQDKLFLVLEYIIVNGDLQRGIKMHGEYVDGILNFFVNYNLFIKKIIQTDIMDTLDNVNIQIGE